jgi:hypothetical protein
VNCSLNLFITVIKRAMGGLWFAPEKDESVPGDHRKTYLQLREELKKEGFKVQPDKESTLKRCQVRYAQYQCHVISYAG